MSRSKHITNRNWKDFPKYMLGCPEPNCEHCAPKKKARDQLKNEKKHKKLYID